MKTIGILQPGYLPWLGFFDQLQRCDIFVLYDDVQYDKNGWRNRNRIKTNQGLQWLTVPVLVKDRPLIKDVKINNTVSWQDKHIKTIKQNYSKAAFFDTYFYQLEAILCGKTWENLADLDTELIIGISKLLGINTPIIRASSIGCTGDRISKLINIIAHFEGDTFLEGSSGKEYIDDSIFSSFGISVIYQEYAHPTYTQLYGSFIPYASIIDLLFNCGDKSLSILKTQGTHQ